MKQPVKKETHILNDNFCNNKRVICIDIDNTLLWMEKGKPQLRPYSLKLLQGFSK